MKKYFKNNSLSIFILFFLLTANSQNLYSQNLSDTTFLEADTLEEKVVLLPEKLGPIKKVFWGEKGLMRITGIAPLTPESREKELRTRRKMLVLHQVFGFITLASMLTADFSGQMILNGKHQYKGLHSAAVGTTIGTYFTTAGLALLSPPPMIVRKKQWDAIRVHKLLAVLHFTGMVLTPILAPGDNDRSSQANLKKNARFHQISAYTTTALFASAIIVIKF